MMMKKALLIGINEYKDKPLDCCVNDVKSLELILKHNEDGSRNFGVKTLLNEEADFWSVKNEIKSLFANDDDVALLYFSGHGYDDDNDGTIVCCDKQTDNVLLKMSEIVSIASRSKCKNKIIILDCCFSGFIGNQNYVGEKTIIDKGLVILTASREKELSIEVNGHGIFTNLLLGALKGRASDLLGNITPASIYSFIDQALGEWDQRPYFKANVSSFISLRQTKPKINLQDLKEGLMLFSQPNDKYQLDFSYEETNFQGSSFLNHEPYATKEHVKIFKVLQKMNQNGLLLPIGEEFMYFAAKNNKQCSLTELGKHYWYLVFNERI